MNKIRALLSLLVLPTIGAQNIAATINSLQASNQGILDQDAFNDENSYQSQARAAALGTLRNPSELYIRNYYALACIYYATNGVSNKITDSILPGCPTLNWLTDDWLLPDYCTWFGITCNNETNVVQIELNENRLYGSWPNEVVLLKNHLEHINLFNNVYHYSEDPRWLAEMIELKYLYFGTTSWEYPGVPTYLGGARKLSKFGSFCETETPSHLSYYILTIICSSLSILQSRLTCPTPVGVMAPFTLAPSPA